jgi:chromosome segregation ATPase
MTITDGATKLISAQIALVVQLQEQANAAIARSDWQSVDRIVGTINTAFTTFLQGIDTMAIDVSALKTVLSSSGSPEQVQALQTSIAELTSQLEQQRSQLEQQQQDVTDLKNALSELNTAAAAKVSV